MECNYSIDMIYLQYLISICYYTIILLGHQNHLVNTLYKCKVQVFAQNMMPTAVCNARLQLHRHMTNRIFCSTHRYILRGSHYDPNYITKHYVLDSFVNRCIVISYYGTTQYTSSTLSLFSVEIMTCFFFLFVGGDVTTARLVENYRRETILRCTRACIILLLLCVRDARNRKSSSDAHRNYVG